jgi:hypothetical protein
MELKSNRKKTQQEWNKKKLSQTRKIAIKRIKTKLKRLKKITRDKIKNYM